MIRGIQLLMNVRKDGGLNMLKRNWRWIVALLIAFFYIRVSGYSLITLLLVVGTVFIIWGLFGSSKKKKRPAEIPDLSKELEAHYEEKYHDIMWEQKDCAPVFSTEVPVFKIIGGETV